jgi:hypothetical protein
MIGVDDVKTDKRKGPIVSDQRHAGDHFAVKPRRPEPFRIRRPEALSVAQSRVPAFARGSLDHDVEVFTLSAENFNFVFYGYFRQFRKRVMRGENTPLFPPSQCNRIEVRR